MPVPTHNPSPLLNDDPVELIFLGTGTSSGLPNVHCLTAPPEDKQCGTCLSTLHPEGKKNIRRNTSVVMRVRGKDGHKITVVIDVGKSFQAAAVEWFPKHGLRRIDAVLITHAHADAMNGLDDLRGWTLRSAIQPHVDLYCSEATFKEVQRAFPYLVSKEYASGGGDVPEFKWHIIEDKSPFEIENTGVWIKPFSVHHGRVFSTAPPVGYEFQPSPMSGSPTSTTSSTPNPPGSPIQHPASLTLQPPPSQPLPPAQKTPQPQPQSCCAPSSASASTTASTSTEVEKPIQPYLCFGFLVQDSVLYISDVSNIPEDVWDYLSPSDQTPTITTLGSNGSNGTTTTITINGPNEPNNTNGTNGTSVLHLTNGVNGHMHGHGHHGANEVNGSNVNGINGNGVNGVDGHIHVQNGMNGYSHSPAPHRGPPVLILDCLCLKTHTSHLGLGDSITYARRFDPQRTYLTGFGHEVSHDEYLTITEAIGLDDSELSRVVKKSQLGGEVSVNVERGLELVRERRGDGKKIWMRPAFDGLKIVLGVDGVVRDEGYDQ